MKIIGVTGGIGSGKSTVARILRDLGAKIIDADKIAREVTAKGEPALAELVDYFGQEILDKDGELNRKYLANIVFNDKKKLEKLNEITHKYIIKKIINKVNKLKEEGKHDLIVLDVPIPVEHGFLDIAEEVWVVKSDKETRIRRIMERSKISYEEALKRIEAQISDDEYFKIATLIIENNGTLEELENTVAKLYIQRKLG
ncbi:MAG TPA: dephospho-CoA kinase [Clostridiaceae bacterium]|nr:dephospho-CoA kinase [Clostridiaceae bacterium]